MKFNKGDYIRYTKENKQQVIDGLMGMGYEVCDPNNIDPNFEVFALKESKVFEKNNGIGFVRVIKNNYNRLVTDRTEDFFNHLDRKESLEIKLPPKFYIDCGDRIEVRERLDSMGFEWISGNNIKNSQKGSEDHLCQQNW